MKNYLQTLSFTFPCFMADSTIKIKLEENLKILANNWILENLLIYKYILFIITYFKFGLINNLIANKILYKFLPKLMPIKQRSVYEASTYISQRSFVLRDEMTSESEITEMKYSVKTCLCSYILLMLSLLLKYKM